MLKVTSFIFTVFLILPVVFKYTEASGIKGTISANCPTPDISRIQLIYPASGTPLTVTWNNSGSNVMSYNIYNNKHKLIRNIVNPSFKNKVPSLGKDQAANYDYYFQAVCNDGSVSAVSDKYIAKVITKAKKHVIKCWGAYEHGQIDVPALTEPSMVSIGTQHTCALDAEGVKCWGNNRDGQASPPTLTNPTMVSANLDHACALDAEGIKCWGENMYGEVSPIPTLTKPSMVSTGYSLTCAIDAEGIKCWGNNRDGQASPPTLTIPHMCNF
ncbi:MAG: cell surface receptor [Burkholderiales bacterium]|nr:cell surface receptor [Burkholderiales bacterium]